MDKLIKRVDALQVDLSYEKVINPSPLAKRWRQLLDDNSIDQKKLATAVEKWVRAHEKGASELMISNMIQNITSRLAYYNLDWENFIVGLAVLGATSLEVLVV